jgi:hypothetical protein
MASIGSVTWDESTGCPGELETEMTDIRRTVFSLVVLAAFLLVLAAPFRWWVF